MVRSDYFKICRRKEGLALCPECGGEGEIHTPAHGYTCYDCGGDGYMNAEEEKKYQEILNRRERWLR